MLNNLNEVLLGIAFILLGSYLAISYQKRCWSTLCKIKQTPEGIIKDKDLMSLIVGILMIIFGITIIFL